jgi:hypothetical protein
MSERATNKQQTSRNAMQAINPDWHRVRLEEGGTVYLSGNVKTGEIKVELVTFDSVSAYRKGRRMEELGHYNRLMAA